MLNYGLGYDAIGRIYLDNRSDKVIKNLQISFGSVTKEVYKVKKLAAKPKGVQFYRKIIPITNRNYEGVKEYVLCYYDENNVKHENVIVNDKEATCSIRIEILKVKEDGELEIKTDLNYNYMLN